MGTVESSAKRPRSPAMRIGRRGSRSIQTPAGIVKRMNGRKRIVPSAATSNGDDSSVMTATRGRARVPTCEPNWLIVSADQSLRKAPCRQRPPFGQRLRIGVLPVLGRGWEIGLRAEQREGENVEVAVRIGRAMEVGEELVQPLLEAGDVLGDEPHA